MNHVNKIYLIFICMYINILTTVYHRINTLILGLARCLL